MVNKEWLIRSQRVGLRTPDPEHGPALVAINRASAAHYADWAAPPIDTESYTRYLERSTQPNMVCMLICSLTDGLPIGAVNLSEIVRGALQGCFMGYYIAAAYAGQGYASEGVRLALDYGFGTLKLHRVEANIQPGNAASLALIRRLGFRKEGFSPRYLFIAGAWRDHERWAMLSEDWNIEKPGVGIEE